MKKVNSDRLLFAFQERARNRYAMARRGLMHSFAAALALCAAPFTLFAQSSAIEGNPDDTKVYWPRPDFVIPFNVDSTGQAPREIRLEYSENGGRSWLVYSSGDVRTKQFHFKAREDGEYQFRLKTFDDQGRSFDNPGEPLCVLVDTTKPDAKLVVDIDPRGVMQAEFEISDLTLDTSTIQLAYQTESLSQWREIPFELRPGSLDSDFVGTGSWAIPTGSSKLVVRLTAKDKAGNQVEVLRLPQLPRSANANGSLQFASGKTSDSKTMQKSREVHPHLQETVGSGVVDNDSFPSVKVISGPGARANNQLDPAIVNQLSAQRQLIDQQNQFISQQQAVTREILSESRMRDMLGSAISPTNESNVRSPESRISKLPVRSVTDEEMEQLKTTGQMSLAANRTEPSLLTNVRPAFSSSPVAPTPVAPTPVASTPAVPSPNAQARIELDANTIHIPGESTFRRNIKPLFSNSKAFSLDYGIDNDPDSPIASVELWGTADQGQTWQMWGQDPDRVSPFDIQVETEGLFGFRMVIVGANGLASNRPRNGDNADAWIHVDTQQPAAKLISALYGKGKEAGSLIIEYRASDDYFPERPITLSFSETPTGPWTTIATGVRNNGRYAWPADPSLPQSIYLRIEAYDAAGNVSVNQLDLPIDVEGLAPRGRFQGFRPIK